MIECVLTQDAEMLRTLVSKALHNETVYMLRNVYTYAA